MKRRNVFYAGIILLCFSSFSFGADLGAVKIMLPDPGCIVLADGVSIETRGDDHSSVLLEPGYHNIKVEYQDGTTLYNGAVKVNSNNTTIVRPEIPDELFDRIGAAKVEQYLQGKKYAEMNDTDYFPGQIGIREGFDNSKAVGVINEVFSGGSYSSSNYSSLMLDLSFFSRWKLANKLYADVELGIMSPCVLKGAAELQSAYVGFGMAYKYGGRLMLGFRPILSAWRVPNRFSQSELSTGFQLFIEIIPISTEIGFVSRYIVAAPAVSSAVNAHPPHMTLDGFYFKYRFNF